MTIRKIGAYVPVSQELLGPAAAARIDPDPLGPINKIISIWLGDRRVKAGLAYVPAGAVVRLVREDGAYSISRLFDLKSTMWDMRGHEVPAIPVDRAPGWYVEVDGREVLYVSDGEIWPPTPAPAIPWRERIRRAVKKRTRATADRVAHRFGYHHESDCTGWDE